jgi:glucokinase
VVGLTLGTGVGSAFLVRGTLVDDGPDVPPEGAAHRLTIDGRPLEDSVSTRAIVGRYAGLASGGLADVCEIAARARRGDEHAHAVLHDAFCGLGRALAPWFARFQPTVVVVGGAMAGSWDLIAAPLLEGLELAPAGRVTPALLREDAALLGAAAHAVDIGRKDEA